MGTQADLFIAGDGLLGVAGLWLRRRKLVSSVLLYSVDFVPNRFRNPVMNHLYHLIDRFDVRHVDVVWNVTKEIEMARRRRDGDHPTAPQLLVPVGADFRQIDRGQQQENTSNEIAFVGHLLEKQGVQLAIQAMPKILATIPGARLVIIGDGPYAPKLRELAARCGVTSAVVFLGPFFDDLEIANRLTRAAVGIAPYVPDQHNFTKFGDPGKIKIYLACGLPVITTVVPPIATTIDQEGAGTVIDYSVDNYVSAALRYLTNTAAAKQARASALALGARFDWNAIFDSAWRETLPLLGNWRSY
jgi:glycosyltransferase involved in cell wall biosynthesis